MTLRNQNLPVRRNDASDVFDRYARDFFSGVLAPFSGNDSDTGFMPRVEVKETDKEYHVIAELPGMKESDIHLSLKENTLVIEGEKRSEKKSEGKGFFRSEFEYGDFYRAIPLNSDVDDKKVEANYKDGLLTISLIKKNDGKEKTVKIPISH